MKSPIKIENVLVIGSGIMGSGIAQVVASSGKFESIVVQDISQDQLDKARNVICDSLKRFQKKNPQIDVESVIRKITFTTEPKEVEVGSGLLVIEAVPEKLNLKQEVFKNIYKKYGHNEKVVLCTNTSSLPCREIGVHIQEKARFCGLHFSNPVPLINLVEIVRVPETEDSTYNAVVQFVNDIKFLFVTCKDNPGFIVNRLLVPLIYSAVEMYEKKVASFQDIDTAMKAMLRWPLGPFELIDHVGVDTVFYTGANFVEDGSPIVNENALLKAMIEKGKLGKKSGSGFYDYISK